MTEPAPPGLPAAAIARACDLAERGPGIVFEALPGVPAFAIRFNGQVHGWRNRCPHQGTPLDWEPGQFFDDDGHLLACATHGALFDPASGLCVSGPCRGARLQRVPLAEQDGLIVPGR